MTLQYLIKQEVGKAKSKFLELPFTHSIHPGQREIQTDFLEAFLTASLTRTVKAVIEEMRLEKQDLGDYYCDKSSFCLCSRYGENKAVSDQETKIKEILS